MRLVICTADENPCQLVNQATALLSDVLAPSVLGITPESIAHVFAWGFGSVLLMFLLGYAAGAAVGLVRKL